MKKFTHGKIGIFFFLLFALFFLGCAEKEEVIEEVPVLESEEQQTLSEEQTSLEDKRLEKNERSEETETKEGFSAFTEEIIEEMTSKSGPWNGNLYLATSDDGRTFKKQKVFVKQAGVPNILRTSEVNLIVVYQYFSFENTSMFNIIAYSVSQDNGKTWSNPTKVQFEDLPVPTTPLLTPVDPTLVGLEDGSLRLYFTYHAKEDDFARLASAHAERMSERFIYEEGIRLADDNQNLLDPAVIFFDGLWHHYAQYMTPLPSGKYDNYHSISVDGLDFELQDSITLDMMMLGNPILVDEGIRFYGSAKGGVVSAFSTDGFMWEMEEGVRIENAGDAAVVELPNEEYLMIYTGHE